jgi:hypothetical protein
MFEIWFFSKFEKKSDIENVQIKKLILKNCSSLLMFQFCKNVQIFQKMELFKLENAQVLKNIYFLKKFRY